MITKSLTTKEFLRFIGVTMPTMMGEGVEGGGSRYHLDPFGHVNELKFIYAFLWNVRYVSFEFLVTRVSLSPYMYMSQKKL